MIGTNYEKPQSSRTISKFNSKNVPHNLEIWGHDVTHDWPTWRKMIPYILETKFEIHFNLSNSKINK